MTTPTPSLVETTILQLQRELSAAQSEIASLKKHTEAMAFISEEYWNRWENSGAMLDALDKLDEAVDAYRAAFPKDAP